jgi:protein-export membrane protein SecD/preprotein translocase SecF subunit
MNERDLWWKIVIVGALVTLGLVSMLPMSEKIKYGIDLAGGYSLLYEIDDTDMESADKIGLSERVMRVLRERVDPKGVFNLVWRPVGHNRLEIQMPRPSEDIRRARMEYDRCQDQIQKTVLRQSQVLRAVSKPAQELPAAMAELVHGIPERQALLESAAQAYDAYTRMKTDHDALVQKVESENVSRSQIMEVCRMTGPERAAAIETLVGAVPNRREALTRAVEAWDKQQTNLRNQLSPMEPAAAPASQPTSGPSETAVALQKASDEAVQAVLDLNVDPDKSADGPTIDKVIDLEDKFTALVRQVLATNLETARLLTILDAGPDSDIRKTGLKEITDKFPGLSSIIEGLVTANDGLKERRHGEGRLEDPADLQRLLRGAGVLEFRILADPKETQSDPNKFATYIETLKTRGPRRLPGEDKYQWFEIDNAMDFFKLRSQDELNKEFDRMKMSGVVAERAGDKFYVLAHIGTDYCLTHRPGEADWSLESAQPDRDRTGRPAIGFRLDERGGSKFAVLTRLNLKQQLAIFIDDFCISHATIDDVIRTSGIIHGTFTQQEVNDMVKKLNAGSLPRKLKDPPISVRSIGPSLGEANREAGLHAALYGGIAVTIFMIGYYFYAGGIAVIAMMMNMIFIGAMMAVLGATLTLPGVAGLALAVGMAVDANVLINERIREELAKGTAMRMAVRLGYERAFSAILDSNVTTVLAAAILYFVGSEEVKGFGLTLGVGVFINIFTAYFVTRMFFEVMCMFPLPKEVFRYPLLAALIIAAGGIVLYGGGYWLNEPAAQDQSVLIFFGEAILWIAVGVTSLVLLMWAFRWVHGSFQGGPKPRIPMLRLVPVPSFDWVGKRYAFYTVSGVMIIGSVALFFTTQRDRLYDIEFLGGTAAQIDLKVPGSLDQAAITARIDQSKETLYRYGQAMNAATLSGTGGVYELSTPGVPAARLEPVLRAVLDKKLAQVAPITYADPAAERVTLRTRSEASFDPPSAKKLATDLGQRFLQAGEAIGSAQVQAVQAVGAGEQAGRSFEIVSRESSKEIVVEAIMETLQNDIAVQPALTFKLLTDARGANNPYFSISTENPKELGFEMSDDEAKAIDLQGWRGGVAMVLDQVEPPQSVDVLSDRLRAMRLQPGFEKHGWRESEVFGLRTKVPGSNLYSRLMVVVADENYPLEDEKGVLSSAWTSELAEPEVELLQAALQRQTSLSQITQFDKQVSADAQLDALIAVVLGWLVIIIYLWFRFGKARWGLAAVSALVHNILITLGFVIVSQYLADSPIGRALLLDKFRIDLNLVAALLTIIGYSVNDTIVVFDRIRENRGRLADVTVPLINQSINQTLPRTMLTGLSLIATVAIMYIVGGAGLHGFSYAMLIGLVCGTYSSVAVAAQFLLRREQLAEGRT